MRSATTDNGRNKNEDLPTSAWSPPLLITLYYAVDGKKTAATTKEARTLGEFAVPAAAVVREEGRNRAKR
jgi:hypothetical protein